MRRCQTLSSSQIEDPGSSLTCVIDPDDRTDGRTDGHTDDRPDGRSVGHMDARQDDPHAQPKQTIDINQDFFYLSPKQRQVLRYLLEFCDDGILTIKKISEALGYPYESTRKHIRALERHNIITDVRPYRLGQFQGKQFQFSRDSFGGSVRPSVRSSVRSSAPIGIEEEDYISSSSGFGGVLQDPRYPELGYWAEQGLTESKLNQWHEQLNCPLERLLLALSHAWFDINHNNRKINSNPLGYVYVILKKEGKYPRPNNYRSMLELQQEEAEDDLARLNQLAEKTKENYRQQTKATLEQGFYEILCHPDSDDHAKIYNNISALAKKRGKGKIFEAEMWKHYLANQGYEPADFA